MISNARGKHSSPGVYIEEIDKTYATKSLGNTKVGLVGETLKGPAFEPIFISDWAEFLDYFGGTSTKKFKKTQYPKYELPYIAKEVLQETKQLEVCRVLGFSGYNAGPAWLLTCDNSVIGVIRSKGTYDKPDIKKVCNGDASYDDLGFVVTEITLGDYTRLKGSVICANGASTGSYANDNTVVSKQASNENYGVFNLNVTTASNGSYTIPVSLNPGDKDYIIDVIGTKADEGDYPVFVEELYDVAHIQAAVNGGYSSGAIEIHPVPVFAKTSYGTVSGFAVAGLDVKENKGEKYIVKEKFASYKIGDVLNVKETVTGEGDTVTYTYSFEKVHTLTDKETVNVNGETYEMRNKKLEVVLNDMSNYKEMYRYASTPWFVSEVKGFDPVEVKKLFRFHTITDGDAANAQIKVSIANIEPETGYFDVLIRDFYDTDSAPQILERYNKCTMVPGTSNYIGLKIGTFDGDYENKSKYVTVEVIENDMTEACVPCGFLGYPLRTYSDDIKPSVLAYNTEYYEDIKDARQYFGMSDLTGVDLDVLNYKGANAYDDASQSPAYGYSNGFHLDSILYGKTVNVDGVAGYKFSTTSKNIPSDNGNTPRITIEKEMEGTIYEDKKMRKFTCYPYGGFDGWDIYRDARTNTNEYKANKYKGDQLSGEGAIGQIKGDASTFGLSGRTNNSDYYAYLAGYKTMDNPYKVDINLFATPGIDYVNNLDLVNEVLDIVEESRQGDCLYVVTTPDKPMGASDSPVEMYTADDAVMNYDYSEINTSYACTYYPWVKYYDATNKKYINLPATKDVLRNFAYTDNIANPWFASAGMLRGSVNCVKAHSFLKSGEEDVLYEGLINPVKSFGSDGIKLWGNKTMYREDTELNRINVRRLMIRVKELVRKAATQLVFEQNDNTLDQQFRSIVKPILDNVKTNRGILDYKIKTDTSAEARDRHELPAKIWVKPIGCVEYIPITFVITPESANFED
jgi:hypothetical protein